MNPASTTINSFVEFILSMAEDRTLMRSVILLSIPNYSLPIVQYA